MNDFNDIACAQKGAGVLAFGNDFLVALNGYALVGQPLLSHDIGHTRALRKGRGLAIEGDGDRCRGLRAVCHGVKNA